MEVLWIRVEVKDEKYHEWFKKHMIRFTASYCHFPNCPEPAEPNRILCEGHGGMEYLSSLVEYLTEIDHSWNHFAEKHS